MNTFLKFLLIASLIAPSAVQAKPCGRGYIADNKVCHKGGGYYLPAPARKVPKTKGRLGSVCASNSECKKGLYCTTSGYCQENNHKVAK